MNPTDATALAIEAVVSSIERCPQALAARDRAAVLIRAAQEPEADLPALDHAALVAAAESAIHVLDADPALSHLITVASLAVYVLKQATVIALGSDGSAVTLDLRPPAQN